MRVLIVGSGGREHALAWKMRQSEQVKEVVCVPGNGGIQECARCIPTAMDSASLADLVRKERIDLVVIGPEAPLADGLADVLQSHRIPVVGPERRAARLESSKVFAKQFMARHSIPTATFSVFTDPGEALRALDSRETRFPIVVKADGLAAGKGVVVAHTRDEARSAVDRIMVRREFGPSGDQIVIEECLEGSEASFIVFTDGTTIIPAVAARDHKAIYDGDSGPNTGGMGAYSTESILGESLRKTIMARVVRPTVEGMAAEGTPFKGILYAGLMLTVEGPKVLEFNVRMGDPEAQVLLPRLGSGLFELCEALTCGRLGELTLEWDRRAAVCVVLASRGYPGPYEKGVPISGLDAAGSLPRVILFHSGTRREGDHLVTAGGRVLGVTAIGENLESALFSAYEAVGRIHFDGMQYRRDIGKREISAAE